MNRYIDILTRNATPITRITCFGLLLLIAMSGMSSARASESVRITGTTETMMCNVEVNDANTVNYNFGRKPTRPRRRSR